MSNKITGAELNSFVRKTAQKVYNTMGTRDILIGTITSIDVQGQYGVRLENSNSTLPTYAYNFNYGEKWYNIGDIVYLIRGVAAQGDIQESSFYILGLATRDLLSGPALVNSLEKFFDEKESESIPEEELNEYLINTENIITLINENRAFKISALVSAYEATFDFGIEIKVNYLDEDSEIFKFNTQYFTGQPYKLNDSYQEHIFELDLAKRDKTVVSLLLTEYGKPQGVNPKFANIKLSSGFLEKSIGEFSFDIAIKNRKNYIYSTTDTTTILGTAKWGNQTIDTSTCNYYWFIKDSSITDKEIDGYSVFGGKGWKILNESKEIFDRNGNPYQIYISQNKELILTNEILKDYKNIIKCVFVYETTEIVSSEIIIYNYTKENYGAKFNVATSPEGIKYLKEATDTITLTCQIIDNNSNKISSGNELDLAKFAYEWFINGIPKPSISYKEDLTDPGQSTVCFTDHRNPSFIEEGKINLVRLEDELLTEFNIICKIYLVDDENHLILLSDDGEEASYTIISHVSEWLSEKIIDKQYYYYWWIENNPSPKISIDTVEEEINDKDITYTKYLVEGVDSVNNGNPIEDYSNILKLNPSGDEVKETGSKYYLFYSSQTVTSQKANETESIVIDKQNFTKPQAIKCCEYINGEWISIRNSEELTQINNFNDLTQNGSSQGLFYTDEKYFITTDETPKANKTYYIIKQSYFPYQIRPNVSGEGDSFINNIYYIKKADSTGYDTAIETDFILVKEEDNSYYIFNPSKVYYIQDPESTKDNDPKYKKLNVFKGFTSGETYYIWSETDNKYIQVTDFSNLSETTIYFTYKNDGYEKVPSISSFESGVDYYEKQDAGDVYINATYIQTGALRVGKEGKEKFYASVDNPEVTIGGFTVTEDSLQTKEYIKNETGFAFSSNKENNMIDSKYFTVDHNGLVQMTRAKLKGSSEIFQEDFYLIDSEYFKISQQGTGIIGPLAINSNNFSLDLGIAGLLFYYSSELVDSSNFSNEFISGVITSYALLCPSLSYHVTNKPGAGVRKTKVNYFLYSSTAAGSNIYHPLEGFEGDRCSQHINPTEPPSGEHYTSSGEIVVLTGAEQYAEIIIKTGSSKTSLKSLSIKSDGLRNYGVNPCKLSGSWTSESAISTSSDANKKNSIQLLPEIYSLIFDTLKPSIFKYNDGQSDRYHTGFIAQDIEQAVLDAGMTTKEFAAVCYNINKETGEKEDYSVRYEELIALCVNEIQNLKAEVKQLKAAAAEEIKGEKIEDDSTTNV